MSLNGIAEHMEGVRKLNAQDEQLLALGQGWAHAAAHSIFFYYRCPFLHDLILKSLPYLCPAACVV